MSDDHLGAREGGQRPPWSAFRSELDAIGFRPTKTLGQNFLLDPNAARSIAADAGLARGDFALEVGCGCGFLTLHLAEAGLELLAAEIDARLLAIAQRLLAGHGHIRWLHGDVLAGKHELAPGLLAGLPAGPWHVVSNLPYSISGPLLALLARLPNPPRSLTVLVQEEVAERVAAVPGSALWGPLSARLAPLYRARLGRAVGAQLFWPRPRVASRVVHLVLQPDAHPPGELADYDALVDGLFQRRRKQLLVGLSSLVGGREPARALLQAAGVDPQARAETLSVAELLNLARASQWRERNLNSA